MTRGNHLKKKRSNDELLQRRESATRSRPPPAGARLSVLRAVARPCPAPGLTQVLSQQGLSYPRVYFLAENGTPPFTLHSFSPNCSNWYSYLSFPHASTLLSKKVKSKAFLMTVLRAYSVPALFLSALYMTVHHPLGQRPSADWHPELDSV